MRSGIHLVKNILATSVAVILAVLSGCHAFSSASMRSSPEVSIAIWPVNGRALERLAYRDFVDDLRKTFGGKQPESPQGYRSERDLTDEMEMSGNQIRRFASDTSAAAVRALKYDPLLPMAHAILAISEIDAARQTRLIALSSQLNRRELLLQGLTLQSRVDAGDHVGAIERLDQILRVHPQREAEFFPLLTDRLKQKVSTPAFRDLLAKPLPWRDRFLMHAVSDPVAAQRLATIRETVNFENPDFDRRLISDLAQNGDIEVAARIYRQLSKSAFATAGSNWFSEYPPFDWTFADKGGQRAQLSKDGRELEFAIAPGNGGVLASRVIETPGTPFSVLVRYQLTNPLLGKDLKLSLACVGQSQPFLESTIVEFNQRLDVDRTPSCDYVVLKFFGRSWTGGEPLKGSIRELLITSR